MTDINEEYEKIYNEDQENGINTEMINGRLIRSPFIPEEDHRLMFLLGTLLADYFGEESIMHSPDDGIKSERDLLYGPVKYPVGKETILLMDIMTVKRRGRRTIPEIAIKVMAKDNQVYNCLDIPFILKNTDISEYWLFDTGSRNVYIFDLLSNLSFRRYSFEQTAKSVFYEDFSFCVDDMMWDDENGLKELAIFYRFKASIPPSYKDRLKYSLPGSNVADEGILYNTPFQTKYSAETFYEWINIRKSSISYRTTAELIMGSIVENDVSPFSIQQIRGNLYFYIKSYLKEHESDRKIMIYPMEIEMTGKDILDSVVAPDLFLVQADMLTDGKKFKGTPDWIIEIATPLSAHIDYVEKAQIYHYHGVQEYWIVNGWKRHVMVLNFDEPPSREKPQSRSTIDKAADMNADDLVNTRIYSYDDYIEAGCIDGLLINMEEIMSIP